MRKAIKPWLAVAVLVFSIGVVGALLADPQGGQGKGGGKGGKGKALAYQVRFNDDFPGARLISDGRIRTSEDTDGDGFGELAMASSLEVTYQDHRILQAVAGAFPDPCVTGIGDKGGFVSVDLDKGTTDLNGPLFQNCNLR